MWTYNPNSSHPFSFWSLSQDGKDFHVPPCCLISAVTLQAETVTLILQIAENGACGCWVAGLPGERGALVTMT